MNMDTPNQGIPRPPQPPRTELPQPLDPSVGVRLAGVVREGVTDLGGLVLLGYLATRGQIPGTWAVVAMLILLVPQPVLLRLAKIAQARASGGAGLSLVAASVAYSQMKTAAVGLTAGAVALGACS
jgi:hypothetical protein